MEELPCLSDDEVAHVAKKARIIPPEFTRTDEVHSPEDKMLLSYLEYHDLSFRMRQIYDKNITQVMPMQVRSMCFVTKNNVEVSWDYLRFVTPRIRGDPMFPSDARNMTDSSYAAEAFVTMTRRELGGQRRVRAKEYSLGFYPVLVYSCLCNLHPYNQKHNVQPAPPVESLDERARRPRPTPEQITRINKMVSDNLQYKYNSGPAEKQLAVYILLGSDYRGYNIDQQRGNLYVQNTPGLVRFISAGHITGRLDIVLIAPKVSQRIKKTTHQFPSIHIHVSEIMRNGMYMNAMAAFHLGGWSPARVEEEIKRFVDPEHHRWVLVELQMMFMEYEEAYADDVHAHFRLRMKDYGVNPLTGEPLEDNHVRHLFFMRLFPHMNDDTSDDIGTRKLRLLLIGIAELLLLEKNVLSAESKDWQSKKIVTLTKNMQGLCQKHINETRHLLCNWMNEQVDVIEIEDTLLDEEMGKYQFTNTMIKTLTSKSRGVNIPNSDLRPTSKKIYTDRRSGENYVGDISDCYSTTKTVHHQTRSHTIRIAGAMGDGIIDPCETPTGRRTGLTEHMTSTAMISPGSNDASLILHVKARKLYSAEPRADLTCVFLINGKFIGWCSPTLEQTLRAWKRHRIIDQYAGITFSKRSCWKLCVDTCEGRLLAIFLTVKDGEVEADKHMPGIYDIRKIEAAGYLEFVDPRERTKQCVYSRQHMAERAEFLLQDRRDSEQRLRIAHEELDRDDPASVRKYKAANDLHQSVLHNYSEIHYLILHQTCMLAPSTAQLPFMNWNNSVRSSFTAKLITQSMTVGFPRFSENSAKQLMQAQKPVFKTLIGEYLDTDANFLNFTVVITAMRKNEEDSICINRKTADMNCLFLSWKAREVIEKDQIRLGLVPDTENWRAYRNIDATTGLPIRGRIFRGGDVLIAMVEKGTTQRDVHMHYGECGMVHAVFVDSVNSDANGLSLKRVRVQLKITYPVTTGSKLAPPDGQKGVIGELVEPEDMPVLIDSPNSQVDMVVNAAPVAGRMTTPTLMFLLYGAVAPYGEPFVATPFTRNDRTSLERVFIENGMADDGMHRILLPTGEIARRRVFVGKRYPCMPLHHHVAPKLHSRGEGGAVDPATKQPPQGRNQNGGFRFSLMEKNELCNIGAMHQVLERTALNSGQTEFIVCRHCNTRHEMQLFKQSRCRVCHSQDLCVVAYPYVMKYVSDLLAIGNIKTEFKLA